jgi:4-hydroxy-tetrahydrodipicolinate reductase
VRIGLLGIGRTGKTVAKSIINQKGMTLAWVLRKSNKPVSESLSNLFVQEDVSLFAANELEDMSLFFRENHVDLIIDFAGREAMNLYKYAIEENVKIISTVSSYSETEIEKLKDFGKRTSILYSLNITVGINYLIYLAKKMKTLVGEDIDISIKETHFKEKKDVSGTAIKIAKELNIKPEESIKSIRKDNVIGEHEICFKMKNQIIKMTHISENREVFSDGVILAANWIVKKPKGFYTMEANLKDIGLLQ